MNSRTTGAGPAFHEAFCRRFGCRPEAFARAALDRCFPMAWAVPGRLWLALSPRTFERELALLRRVALAPTEGLIWSEFDGYLYENQRDRPFRVRVLGLRLSRRRFARLYRRVMAGTEAAT